MSKKGAAPGHGDKGADNLRDEMTIGDSGTSSVALQVWSSFA
jgi:hypothetical protein